MIERDYNDPQTVRGMFTREECNHIIELCKKNNLVDGLVYERVGEKGFKQRVNTIFRQARNWVLPEDGDEEYQWIRDRLYAAGRQINDSYFEFDLTRTHQDRLAFVHYPPGGHFQQHVDNLGQYNGLFKKLTCVVQLSDPDSYQGGDLVFTSSKKRATKEQGSMIAFPSYIPHGVLEVTGDRYILVNWCHGERHFR